MNGIVNQSDIEQLLKSDQVFKRIHYKYGPPPDWKRPPGFISLLRIILEQQVSLAAANAHYARLEKYLGTITASKIVLLSDSEMTKCQISRQKAVYLKALSSSLISKEFDLDNLGALSPDNIRVILKSVKGIGDWTADVYMVFCMQQKDIFPSGDIALKATVKELTGVESINGMVSLSEKWRPLRSLAAFYLWHYYLEKRGRSYTH